MATQVSIGSSVVSADIQAPPRPVAGGVLLAGNPVRVEPPGRARRFYRHGWQSWSLCGWVDPFEPLAPSPVPELRVFDDPFYALAPNQGGSAVGAVDCGDGTVLLLGATGLGGRVEVEPDGRLIGTYEGLDEEWFAAYGDEQAVFTTYADLLGARLGTRKRPTPRIWCSWYSFFTEITETRLTGVLAEVGGLPIDSFQVDDGWQVEVGDWEPNAGFPSGMDRMADAIRDAGFRPGLWIAPFLAHERSRLFTRHPELCLRGEDRTPAFAGHNWGGRVYALDVTHPGTQEVVAQVVERAVGWGYEYLKLDFLYAAALAGARYESIGREHAYRRAVELIREVAGDDVYLLACGAPVVASIGVFDGIRIGPDVAPWWEMEALTRYLHAVSGPNTRYAIATSVNRLWLQPLIDLDPDVVFFRTRYNLLDDHQRALLRDLALVARFKATSDPPAWLDPAEREQLAAFLAAQPEIRRVDRYRFLIDGREVDFGPVASAIPLFAQAAAISRPS